MNENPNLLRESFVSSSQNSDFPSSISHRAPQGEALTVLETKLIVLLSRQESPAVEAATHNAVNAWLQS